MIREFLWRIVARIVTIPAVARWLRNQAGTTPYTHIRDADGSLYMGRWWLFNAYGKDETGEPTPARWPWLPSVRIHWIRRPDNDRHLHDHPWNARTIVLDGWYEEERPYTTPMFRVRVSGDGESRNLYRRGTGYTGRLLFGQYHRIREVSPGGVWTLFFTWKKRGTWGFMVDGVKVPWRKYLGLEQQA